jgi:hypothetical protein
LGGHGGGLRRHRDRRAGTATFSATIDDVSIGSVTVQVRAGTREAADYQE